MGDRMRWMILAAAVSLPGCGAAPEPPISADTEMATLVVPIGDPVEGLRVATRVGCLSCHGAEGGGRKLWEDEGKYRLFSPNLTQRRGLYDDAGIEALLRQGKTHDGHRPFGMPIRMFQNLSDREVRDITAWLNSLPAAADHESEKSWFSEETRQQLLDGSFAENEDRADPSVTSPVEPPTEALALGRHLAMTSCSECHAQDLNGAEDFTPSLIVAKAYSAENFARLMKTGITANGSPSATGLMTEMGASRFSAMNSDEVAALKLYLDSR